jgi:crotonobetainyl-CoA:carnitine CoA-transferase CaiB-like acyl-CoA transferase
MLDAVLSEETTRNWLDRLAGQVPVAPVNDLAQALESPFVEEQGLVAEGPHPVRGTIRTMACPIRCPGETLPLRAAPRLGADTADVLARSDVGPATGRAG